MPRGPKGERRPADVIGNAALVMKIARGEVEDYPARRREGPRREGAQEERKPIQRATDLDRPTLRLCAIVKMAPTN